MPRRHPSRVLNHSTASQTARRQRHAETEPALESNPGTPFDLVTLKRAAGGEQPRSGTAWEYRAGDILAGKYKLLRILGQGGMSAVWAVQNLVLDAQFALKLIRNDDGDAHAAERMLREARSAARIEHPAIIRMFDFGVTDRGDPFLVMDLLTAPSVRERLLEAGKLSPVEAVRLLLPIAEALSVVHSHGIVHRDLKPDNILCVTAGGARCQPKLIDFGIAKQLGDEAARITQVGLAIGSPEYMSPEQALGLSDIDHHTDIWSFCVVLYEMVTGRTPFVRGDDVAAVLHAIIHDPVRPLSDFKIRDPELWAIIVRGLQKVPDSRWPNMQSLGVALAKWLLHQGVEEDVCLQSLRMIWLGTSSSAPPVAIDTRSADRARIAALNEAYEVPTRGIGRTIFGLAAATLAMVFIVAAGIHATRSSNFGHATADTANSPSPPPRRVEAVPVPVPPPLPPEASIAPIVPPTPSPEPSPETRAPAATVPEKASAAAPAPAPDVRASSRQASQKRTSPRPSKTRPDGLSKRPTLDDMTVPSTVPGETTLPELKAPPDFGGRAPEQPSDNPYVDDNDQSSGGSSDIKH